MPNKRPATFSTLSEVRLQGGASVSEVEVLRVGVIRDRNLKITPDMLSDYVRNFQERTYGQDIPVNRSHDREGEAVGWVRELFVRGESLMASIEWNPLGVQAITDKVFKYVSSELAHLFTHPDTGKKVPNVYIGCALTNIPALKGQRPLELSEFEQSNSPNQHTMKNLIAGLKARKDVSLAEVTLAKTVLASYEGDDKAEMETGLAEVEAAVTSRLASLAKCKECGEGTPAEGEEVCAACKKALAAKGEADKKLAEAEAKAAKLAEDLAGAQVKLQEQALGEKFEADMMLSEKRGVGLSKESKERTVKFMAGLSETQRDEFAAILSEVKGVDLTEHGTDKDTKVKLSAKDDAGRIVELAEIKMKADPKLTPAEAQNLAAAELGIDTAKLAETLADSGDKAEA